jgi:tyrosine ammonia-lyase
VLRSQDLPASLDIGGDVTPHDIAQVARGRRRVVLGEGAAHRMASAHAVLQRMVAERRRIYGVTTGYGPLASHPVAPEHAAQLQRNLVYHLASGVGAPLSEEHARATIAARAASLARGHSGIGEPTFRALLDLLERGVTPVIPEMGTVGASGDLTPLAHVALVLMGEGEAFVGGERLPAAEALARAGMTPVAFGHKEAIALVNGTSCMTGIAAVNAARAHEAVHLALRLAVLHAEVLSGRREAWDPRFAEARPHPGQLEAHVALARFAAGSARLQATVQPPPVLDETHAVDGWLPEGELPQDPYTIRCVPQLVGAILDVLDFHDRTVRTELGSATDNPLVFPDDDAILHGGNFYGQHVSFASDALAMAIVKLGVWTERALARVTDRAQNHGLPAFLHGGADGVNSGFMGAQVTASALVAEMRAQCVPASIQSVPTNANNQDVVTMGTIAARKAAQQLALVRTLQAIQALALAQAAELRSGPSLIGFAPESRALVAWVRELAPPLGADRPLSFEIERVATALDGVDWSAPLAPARPDPERPPRRRTTANGTVLTAA